MKWYALIITTIAIACTSSNHINNGCYKGRLEISAICSNYTIKLLEGNLPPGSVDAEWTDEQTGKRYTNVFSLSDPCVLPAGLKEGDEFYFTINKTDTSDCVVCQAYYPTPPSKLNIKVLNQPCTVQ